MFRARSTLLATVPNGARPIAYGPVRHDRRPHGAAFGGARVVSGDADVADGRFCRFHTWDVDLEHAVHVFCMNGSDVNGLR